MDSDSAMQDRQENPQNAECDFQLMSELDKIIRQVNPYAQAYKMMAEVYREAELANRQADVRMFIHKDRTQDVRRYNVACSNEVALIFTASN